MVSTPSSISRPVLVFIPQSCLPFGGIIGSKWFSWELPLRTLQPLPTPPPPRSLGDGCYATFGDVTSEECEKGGGACCGTRAVADSSRSRSSPGLWGPGRLFCPVGHTGRPLNCGQIIHPISQRWVTQCRRARGSSDTCLYVSQTVRLTSAVP